MPLERLPRTLLERSCVFCRISKTQELIAQVMAAQAQEQAEQAEPKAEQAEAKPKAAAKPAPLTKPKAKPQPQPQAPHPPLPPPHPLAAKKWAKAAPEDTVVEEMRGELRGLLTSLAAQKTGKARLESKVSQWETKLAEVRGIGDEERIRMAEVNLRKAKAKVVEKGEGIEALDRNVRRMEVVLVAAVDKVKEEVEEEVVEVDVEPEEMVEETVKEELEAKVVVETPAAGGGGGGVELVAPGNDGVEGCGGHPGPPMGPGCPG